MSDYHLSDGVDPGISYSMTYTLWESAIAAGATMDELQKMHSGMYSSKFLATLIAWHGIHQQIDSHIEDAKAKKSKSK